MLRKFTVTSVLKIYTKMWKLCMPPDYDHFIPLTSKQGKFQPQTNILSGNNNPFILSLTVVWVDRSRFLKKKTNFSSLRSCYHQIANRKKLILPLGKYFKTTNDIVLALLAQNFQSHLQFFKVGKIMVSKYGHLMLPGAFLDIKSDP